MLALSEIKKIIDKSGLIAEFRSHDKQSWDLVNKKVEIIPVVYTWHFVDYNTVYFNSFSDSSIDISLIIYNDNMPCAIWPLVFDGSKKEPLKSINNQYGGIVIPPLFIDNFSKKSQRRIIKFCVKFLNLLLEESNGECWKTNDLSTKGDVGYWHQIILEKGGVLDKINYAMYVDLTMSIEQIRSNIRKSFRPLISSGLKKWNVRVMDKYNDNTWEEFRELHKAVAGRVTRSIETWNIQREAIKSSNAFLVYVVDSNDNMVGGGYFDMSDYECNYSSGVYNRELSDQPLGHIVQYHAILTMKDKGRKLYLLGDRFYNEELPYITHKRVQISNFQQGFSSKILPKIGLIFQSVKNKKEK